MGVGSASIMLIFAVLCLTVFSLISLSVAETDKSLADTEAELVTEYYEADEAAERILSVILETEADIVPAEINGVSITTQWDMDLMAEVSEYTCPISAIKELSVKVAVSENSFDILVWKMITTDEWVIDDTINVWTGDEDFGFGITD